jgi:hypothetical protein
MAAGDDYRIKAADMNAKARQETSPQTRSELKKLVLAYLRLADHADRNADVAPPAERSRPPVQQQQQQQPSQRKPPADDVQ